METNTEWSATLNTNGTNTCYKIDWCQVSVIPENQIKTLKTKSGITKSTTTLSAYNGSSIPVKKQGTSDNQYHSKNALLLFIVADTNYLRIDLIQIILSVSNSQKHNFLYEFKVCFGEKVHYITIDQNLTSFITPAGKILIALLDKVKLELEIM